MLNRKTFNKYKKLLNIKGDFPYNNHMKKNLEKVTMSIHWIEE